MITLFLIRVTTFGFYFVLRRLALYHWTIIVIIPIWITIITELTFGQHLLHQYHDTSVPNIEIASNYDLYEGLKLPSRQTSGYSRSPVCTAHERGRIKKFFDEYLSGSGGPRRAPRYSAPSKLYLLRACLTLSFVCAVPSGSGLSRWHGHHHHLWMRSAVVARSADMGVSSAVGHKSKSRLAQCHPGLALRPWGLINGFLIDMLTHLKVNNQVDHSKTGAHMTKMIVFFSFSSPVLFFLISSFFLDDRLKSAVMDAIDLKIEANKEKAREKSMRTNKKTKTHYCMLVYTPQVWLSAPLVGAHQGAPAPAARTFSQKLVVARTHLNLISDSLSGPKYKSVIGTMPGHLPAHTFSNVTQTTLPSRQWVHLFLVVWHLYLAFVEQSLGLRASAAVWLNRCGKKNQLRRELRVILQCVSSTLWFHCRKLLDW
ncbi:hypothetical protein VP01_2616g1 [Puccinia sorghi]|uniref:Uncharacterized protein n=1 Tax=Puccinia sorghi TaxID=27349 RepID=A0A0L6V4K0_9BASI|nr:hypothetical protein VP01_2616g1 [Puccinia sorghi]